MNIGGVDYCDGTGANVPNAAWGSRVACPVCGRGARVTKANTLGAHSERPHVQRASK